MKMNKKRLLIISFITIILTTGFMLYNINQSYKVVTFKEENGWGYNIFYKKKIIIHQPYMPVISGQKAFISKKYARETGKLVADKLKKHKLPRITSDELDAIVKN